MAEPKNPDEIHSPFSGIYVIFFCCLSGAQDVYVQEKISNFYMIDRVVWNFYGKKKRVRL